MDCASLHAASPAGGGGVIKGTVPNALDQAKLLAIAARLPADTRPEISVAIVPPPVCRPLSDFGKLQAAGIVEAGGIEIGLAHGVTTLHEGDPIAIEVTSRHDFPVNLRIDYFTLGGEVLHMWPNADLPTAKLAAGATSEFLKRGPGNKVWQIGGAPFGTELITAIATAAPLDLSAARPAVEPAGDYLRDLKSALSQVPSSAGEANLAATLLIHTSEK
jgi:hypothetical protein